MAMKWQGVSEVVIGKAILGEINPDSINPNCIYPNYRAIVPLLQAGLPADKIVEKTSYSDYSVCKLAGETVNGTVKPGEWLSLLGRVATKAVTAERLRPMMKKLEEGDDVDIVEGLKILSQAEEFYHEFTPLSEVSPNNDIWMLTGYEPIDRHMGGIPKASLTIMGASPGVGKTSLALQIAKSVAKLYKDKKVAVFSLEMTMGQVAQRIQDMDKKLSKEVKSRILLKVDTYSVNEVYASASRLAAEEGVSLICIDFADQLVEGEQSESIMGLIYRNLAMLAKKTGVPVLLISQLNRSTYSGGEPRINHLRYSGLAEAMAALIILIYNPANILISFEKDRGNLQIHEGSAYLIFGKSRFGFKEKRPGAVLVDWDGELGWGDKSKGYFPISP